MLIPLVLVRLSDGWHEACERFLYRIHPFLSKGLLYRRVAFLLRDPPSLAPLVYF